MLDKNIIKLLEEKSGHPLNSSSACERLALDIESKTGEQLGFTTLKRLLGNQFLHLSNLCNNFTANIINNCGNLAAILNISLQI